MIGNKKIHKEFADNGWTVDLMERCYLTEKDERGSVETAFSTSLAMMDNLGCKDKAPRIAGLASLMEAVFPRKDMPKLEHSTSDLMAVYLSFMSSVPDELIPGVNEYLVKKSNGEAKVLQKLVTEVHGEFTRSNLEQMSNLAPLKACLEGGFDGEIASLFTS